MSLKNLSILTNMHFLIFFLILIKCQYHPNWKHQCQCLLHSPKTRPDRTNVAAKKMLVYSNWKLKYIVCVSLEFSVPQYWCNMRIDATCAKRVPGQYSMSKKIICDYKCIWSSILISHDVIWFLFTIFYRCPQIMNRNTLESFFEVLFFIRSSRV